MVMVRASARIMDMDAVKVRVRGALGLGFWGVGCKIYGGEEPHRAEGLRLFSS